MIKAITQELANKLELREWSAKVLLRPMGYDLLSNKFTVVLSSGNLSKEFIVKISSSANLNELLREEVNNAVSLRGFGVSGIPEITLHGLLDGRYFMAQEFVTGAKPHSSRGTFEAVYSLTRDWLLSLAAKTGGTESSVDDLLRKTEEYLAVSSEFFPISDSLALMEKTKPSSPVPTSWAHGDFWHGNLIVDPKGGLWVTDFAFSAPGQPSIDVLDLIADYDPEIFLSPEKLSKFVSPFIPNELNPLFLVLYSLNRKIALKVKSRKKLYEELLILNLSEELSRIEEVGILNSIVMRVQSHSH